MSKCITCRYLCQIEPATQQVVAVNHIQRYEALEAINARYACIQMQPQFEEDNKRRSAANQSPVAMLCAERDCAKHASYRLGFSPVEEIKLDLEQQRLDEQKRHNAAQERTFTGLLEKYKVTENVVKSAVPIVISGINIGFVFVLTLIWNLIAPYFR